MINRLVPGVVDWCAKTPKLNEWCPPPPCMNVGSKISYNNIILSLSSDARFLVLFTDSKHLIFVYESDLMR